MTRKSLTLCVITTACFASMVHAEDLINNPNLPHPAAAVAAYEDHEKVVRNENVAKAGVAKGATQIRPVNGRINKVGTPRLR